MNCPICNKELKAERNETGIERYCCDCAGFSRAVVEIISDEMALEAKSVNVKKKGSKHDDRSN